jgi:hypothetical protein
MVETEISFLRKQETSLFTQNLCDISYKAHKICVTQTTQIICTIFVWFRKKNSRNRTHFIGNHTKFCVVWGHTRFVLFSSHKCTPEFLMCMRNTVLQVGVHTSFPSLIKKGQKFRFKHGSRIKRTREYEKQGIRRLTYTFFLGKTLLSHA